MKHSPTSSTGSSTTSTVLLGLRRSRIALACSALWLLALSATLLLIARDGYLLAALAAGACTLLCLAAPRGERPRALCWHRGSWYALLPDAGWREIELLPPARCLPLLVCLRWRRTGGRARNHLYLWPDSGDADSLRRLRKRLRLSSLSAS